MQRLLASRLKKERFVNQYDIQHIFHRWFSIVTRPVPCLLFPYSPLKHNRTVYPNRFQSNMVLAYSKSSTALYSTIIDTNINKIEYTQDYVDNFFDMDFTNENYSPYEVAKVVALAGSSNCNINLIKHYAKILEYLETSSEVVTSKNICRMIYGMGGKNYEHSNMFFIIILQLSNKLSTTTEECTGKDIAKALFGLRHLTDERMEVNSLIIALTKKLQRCNQQSFGAISISASLSGLQNMNPNSEVIRHLYQCLIPKIESSVELFNAKLVAMIAFVFKYTYHDTDELYQLIKALTPKIESCPEPLSAYSIQMIMRGLQHKNTDNEAVRNLIKLLIPKVESCTEVYSVKRVESFLFSFRKFKSEDPDVLLLLKAFLPKIESSTGEWTANAISKILFAIKSLNTDHLEVRMLLNSLIPKIESCVEPFNGQSSINILQHFNQDYEEISRLFKALELKTTEFNKTSRIYKKVITVNH